MPEPVLEGRPSQICKGQAVDQRSILGNEVYCVGSLQMAAVRMFSHVDSRMGLQQQVST